MKSLLEVRKEGSKNLNPTGREWAMNKLQRNPLTLLAIKR